MDYLAFGSYLDIELLNFFFYDGLKLRFGDYENFVSTCIISVCNILDNGFWLMDT